MSVLTKEFRDAVKAKLGIKPRDGKAFAVLDDPPPRPYAMPTPAATVPYPNRAFDPELERIAGFAIVDLCRNRDAADLPRTVDAIMEALTISSRFHATQKARMWRAAIAGVLVRTWGWRVEGPSPDAGDPTPPPSWGRNGISGRAFSMQSITVPSMTEARRREVVKEFQRNGGSAMLSIDPPRDDETTTDPGSDKANRKVIAELAEKLIRERRRALSAEEIQHALEQQNPRLNLIDLADVLNGSQRSTLDGQLRPRFQKCHEAGKGLLYGLPGVTFHKNTYSNPILQEAEAACSGNAAMSLTAKPQISEARRRELVKLLSPRT
jgi:hypothetical protein